MSYNNFMPTIWSEKILSELDRWNVFKDTCDYSFEGEAKRGAEVKILAVGAPTIGTYVPNTKIKPPERVPDSSVYLKIDQYRYFNYGIDDVDKAQAKKGVMGKLATNTSRAIAAEYDEYIAKLCAKEAGHKIASTQVTDGTTALKLIDDAFVMLWDEGVRGDIDIMVAPWYYRLLKNELTEIKTDNDNLVKTGTLKNFNGALIHMSHNLFKDNTDTHIIVKTRDGVATANGIDEVEAFRPHDDFSDAIKGLHCYGAKAVRPKEIVCIKAHQ